MEAIEKLSYSFDTAAEATSISKDQWRKMVRLGKIRIARVGRRVLIPAAELKRITAAGYVLEISAK